MKITFKQTIECQGSWISRISGVILVKDKKDINPLFNLLVEQDPYWKYYKNLIKVLPKKINGYEDLKNLCSYVGKTDIDDIKSIQDKIDFMIYQYNVDDIDY